MWAALASWWVVCAATPWWDGGFTGPRAFRVPVEVINGPSPKDSYPVTAEVNFTEVLLDLGEVGALDEGSIRVVRSPEREDEAVHVVVPHLFERSPDFASVSNARGWISWVTDSDLKPNAKILYHVYFDILAHGVQIPDVPLGWELVGYHPANLAQQGSFEPELASPDASKNPWRGWSGTAPLAVGRDRVSHWGRWSSLIMPASTSGIEVWLPRAGRPYLLGGYVRASCASEEPPVLVVNFTLGELGGVRFTKEQQLSCGSGWWRTEIPVPMAPEGGLLSLTFSFRGQPPDTLWVDDLFVYEDPPAVVVGRGERMP